VTVLGPTSGMSNFDRDRWQLFHTDQDRSEAHDLAAQRQVHLRPGHHRGPGAVGGQRPRRVYKVLAKVELTPTSEGVIFAQGSRFGAMP
jgi:hypothetical protein